MGSILKIKDSEGHWVDIPAIQGVPGSPQGAYPVGAVYMSTDPAEPATLLGGGWQMLGNSVMSDGETTVYYWKRTS